MPIRRRRRGGDRSGARPPVVVGQEVADALAVEKRHRCARRAQSPLEGVAYDVWSGELDLHRFVESPVDDALEAFVAEHGAVADAEAAARRETLTMDDLYTLLAFAHRAVMASLLGRAKPSLSGALVALTAVDSTRVDWRDASVAAELIGWAYSRAGVDHAAHLRAASARAEPRVAEMLNHVASRGAEDLAPGMWRCVAGPAGFILVDDYFERFDPTRDLIEVAFEIQTVVEEDAYRVGGLTVGSDLPEVWLSGDRDEEVQHARERIRACVIIRGDLHPAADRHAKDQQLLVFLTEAESADEADVIATAAQPKDSYEALGVSAGALCCVVVARSVVIGVRPFEKAGSLQRFAEPLERILSSAAHE